MCQALTAKVIEPRGKTALARIGKIQKEIKTELFPVKKGDRVLVFGGFAVEKLK